MYGSQSTTENAGKVDNGNTAHHCNIIGTISASYAFNVVKLSG